MRATTSLFIKKGSANLFWDEAESEDSGQVVTAPEPVGGEPERFIRPPGAEGLGGSSAPGAPSKSRQWGGGVGSCPSLVCPPNNSTGRVSLGYRLSERARRERRIYRPPFSMRGLLK